MSPTAQTEAADQGSARDHEQSTCAATPKSAAKGFTLDTSGAVRLGYYSPTRPWDMTWSDLDAFTQGYIEALFADADFEAELEGMRRDCWQHERGFSDLHPEALAAILKDCGDYQGLYREFWGPEALPDGATFWALRAGGGSEAFPPLTPHLGDDGRVNLTTGA